MRFQLESLLTDQQLLDWRGELLAPDVPWRPGEQTAGWHARAVKHNRQLDLNSQLHQSLAAQISKALLSQPLLCSAALPVQVHGLLFSLCGPGEGYGSHVDNAFMAAGRSDLSFTLFLTPVIYLGVARFGKPRSVDLAKLQEEIDDIDEDMTMAPA